MKKMNKMLLVFLLAGIIFVNTVYAEAGKAVYNGKEIIVTGATDEQNLLPGQTITVEVEVVNQSSNPTNWYIANAVLESFEDTSDNGAKGGGYTYVLSYNGNDLYNSDKVGGTDEGLNQLNYETDQKYFFLGSLGANASGKITMKVGLDGESQANAYELASAALQLSFAVEEVVPKQEKKVVKFYIPHTGIEEGGFFKGITEMNYLIVCLCILVISGSAGYLFYSHGKERG